MISVIELCEQKLGRMLPPQGKMLTKEEQAPEEAPEEAPTDQSQLADYLFNKAVMLNKQSRAMDDEARAAQEEEEAAAEQEEEDIAVAQQVANKKKSARVAARVEDAVSQDLELKKLQVAQQTFAKKNQEDTQKLAQLAEPPVEESEEVKELLKEEQDYKPHKVKKKYNSITDFL